MEHRLTLRSFIAGFILANVLCAINSYLTLSFGIMEEGPAIAALFFYAAFFLSSRKVTTAEMVIVATMGSAGGSLGFIANFFAAQAMVVAKVGGLPYTIGQMTLFALSTSVIGLATAILFRQILIVKDAELPEGERLPWVGARAVQGVIDPLVQAGDPLQPRYLLCFTLAAIFYVIFNDEGVGWFPSFGAFTIAGLSAYGVGIAFAPFVWGGSYLMGLRTCFGFLTGGVILFCMAQGLPSPKVAGPFMPTSANPQAYVWPGIMFLITSGLTSLALNWRVIGGAFRSLFNVTGGEDRDPIMSGRAAALFTLVALVFVVTGLHIGFHVPVLLVLTMVVVGGLLLNLIATRAAAQTYFNPARVMGILLMGVNTLFGGSAAMTNLSGAGFIAGSGSQSGVLTNDLAFGFWYRLKSRWQFWTQAATLITCTSVAAVTFWLIRQNFTIALDGGNLAAPVAKTWAAMALLFDPASKVSLPPFAVQSMWIAGIVGVVYALLEARPAIRKVLPGSIGIGLGLILPIGYDLGFFAGGIMMWVVLRRFLRISDITCNTIAISCIVGEGIGGISQAVLKTVGLIAH